MFVYKKVYRYTFILRVFGRLVEPEAVLMLFSAGYATHGTTNTDLGGAADCLRIRGGTVSSGSGSTHPTQHESTLAPPPKSLCNLISQISPGHPVF